MHTRIVRLVTFVAALTCGALAFAQSATPPHAVSILKPASGTYHPGNIVAIGVRFNATGVTYTGHPRLVLHLGGATRYAEAFTSLNDVLAFGYTVDPSDSVTTGATIDSAIDLNGGSISIDNNSASPSLADLGADALSFPGVTIDTAPPSGNTIVRSATATGPANSAYTFYYDPIVSGPAAPSFSASGLPSWLQASSTTGAVAQAGSVTVPATASFSLTADGGRGTTALIKANLVSPNTDALADPYTPMSVGVPVDATYYVGMPMYFSVTYDNSGPLKVIGTPQLNFTIGGQARSATYTPGYRNDQLVFVYTVAIGDNGVVSPPNHLDGDFFAYTLGGSMPNHTGWPYIVDTSHIFASGGSAPYITSAQTATTRVNTAFTYTITALSPPNPTSFDASPLPDGLTVDHSTGVISGTPVTAGTYSIAISATSTAGTATGALTLTVQPPMAAPVITYPGDTLETWWHWYDPRGPAPAFLVQATDGPSTFAATGLPPYVYMTSYGHVEPNSATPGVYDVTFTATNSIGTTSKQVHWTVYPALEDVLPHDGTFYEGQTLEFVAYFSAPVTVTGSPTLTVNGVPPSHQATYVSGSGTAALHFALPVTPEVFSGSNTVLPGALNLNGGTISAAGLPAVLAYSVHQSVGEPIPGIKLITHPRFTSALSDSATVGTSYTYQLKAENWVNKYDVANLPDGLTFASDQSKLTGTISGTPRTAGTYNITLEAWNQFYTDPTTATLVLTVNPAGTPPPPTETAQTITFAQVTSATVGQPITINATASSGLPVSLSLVSGNATLNGTTLIINDSNPVVVRGTQAGGNGYAAATADLTVAAGKSTQQITFVSPPTSVAVGQSVRVQATSSVGLPVAISVLSGPGLVAGDSVTATGLGTIVVRATQAGNGAYSAAVADVAILAVRGDQHIDFSSPISAIYIGQPVRLGALASSGLPVTYTVVSGPATITGDMLTINGPGQVVIRATQAGTDAIASASAEITVTGTAVPTSRLVNVSSRARVIAGDDNRAFIAGFVVTGTAPKRLLLRAVGPTLTNYQVSGVLADPRLRLVDTNGHLVAENDNWSGTDVSDTATHVGAFSLPTDAHDAALVVTLPPGGYTMQIMSNGGDGVALAEVYDASDNPTTDGQKLINISTRAYVDTGENVLVAGFVVSGDSPKRVLIRGIGPTLANYAVTNPLSDPMVNVYHDNAPIARNDNWETGIPTTAGEPAATAAQIAAAATSTGAFPLQPGSKDAALVLTLSPGLYSAVVSGSGGATGNGMVEIYELPSP